MPTYPAHIICPWCGRIAANMTIRLAELVQLLKTDESRLDRFLLRTDQGKPGPSHHVVCCQHCHSHFKAAPGLIVNSPRTIAAT